MKCRPDRTVNKVPGKISNREMHPPEVHTGCVYIAKTRLEFRVSIASESKGESNVLIYG